MVLAALTEYSTICCRQELLLTILRVCDLRGKLLRRSSHLRLFARVGHMLANHDSTASEVELDVVQVLVLVQTDLDSSIASAYTFHIVLLECN